MKGLLFQERTIRPFVRRSSPTHRRAEENFSFRESLKYFISKMGILDEHGVCGQMLSNCCMWHECVYVLAHTVHTHVGVSVGQR